MSLVEDMITTGRGDNKTTITPIQRTIVDQCVKRCYEQFMSHDFDQEYIPTLLDLQNELDKEKGVEDGRQVAVGVEYYTRGSMNVFANKTNVAVSNRLVVFNVRDLGDQLRQIALSIIFDFIWNRMVDNKNRGVRTYCYADEIHVMFNNEFSAEYLKQLYKRGRKYGLCITGLTQNVEDLLRTEKARGMIGNSDFIMMLNQNGEDLKLLAELLNISETQMGFVIGAEAGSGLIFAEKIIVPFEDRFPEDSYLYKLMSTRFGENMTETEIEYKIKTIIETTPMIDPNEKIEEDKDEAL
jgi:type IV secretory pathway VirB4 component